MATSPPTDQSAASCSLALDSDRQNLEDFLRCTEFAALNTLQWMGKGDKEAGDYAACDAIRGMFDLMDIRGEVVIGEGIKDEAPGLFKGEKVGMWRDGAPMYDIAIDPVDGTTNLSKGLPNAISCLAAASRDDDSVSQLQDIPAFYMDKLAYPPEVRAAFVADPKLPIDVNAPIEEVIKVTAQILNKEIRDVVVMVLDRPRNERLIESIRSVGASLRMIGDGDIAAALAPALRTSGIDLYAGIGGSPEGVLSAAALRCLGGGMQARIWPRDEAEKQSLIDAGWGGNLDTVYLSKHLAKGQGILFCATGISDSPLLNGVEVKGSTAITHSILMRVKTGTVRFVTAHHNLNLKTIRLRSANTEVEL
ncbi:MAG: class II fructose-bisphosphatase [Planctomycetota bacterium]